MCGTWIWYVLIIAILYIYMFSYDMKYHINTIIHQVLFSWFILLSSIKIGRYQIIHNREASYSYKQESTRGKDNPIFKFTYIYRCKVSVLWLKISKLIISISLIVWSVQRNVEYILSFYRFIVQNQRVIVVRISFCRCRCKLGNHFNCSYHCFHSQPC